MRERANALGERLKKVPLNYFTVGDLEDLMSMTNLHYLRLEVRAKETLDRLEKICEKFEKENGL